MVTFNKRGMPLLIALVCALSSGCAAMTNPIADGIPVRLLPPELLGPSKTNYQTIPLNILRQPQPEAHRLDAGDIIGVSSLDFRGKEIAPPLPVAPGVHGHEQTRLPIANGHPVTVQEDGKIVLPRVPK